LLKITCRPGPEGLLRDTAFKQGHDGIATAVFDLLQISPSPNTGAQAARLTVATARNRQ
jgi:hypothetical protein